MVNIPAKEEGPAYDVVAIIDPTTRAAQKYTPVLMVSAYPWLQDSGISSAFATYVLIA